MVSISSRLLKILLITSIILLVIGGTLGVISFTIEPYYTKEIAFYSYTKNSEMMIVLLLKPNKIYEKTVAILTPGNSTYLNLVEEVNVSHTYRVYGGVFVGNYNLTISLSHPDGWSKKYLSIVDKINSSTHTRSILINISEIITYMKNICKQISTKATQLSIVIEVKVTGYVETDHFNRGDQQLHKAVVHIDLLTNKIFVRGDLTQTARTDEKSYAQEVNYLLGFPITFIRTLSLVIASTGSIEFIVHILMYFRIKRNNVIKDFESRYHELIIESRNIAKVAKDSNSIYVSSLEELVKIAKILEKPITKVYGDNIMYVVLDKGTRYVFELKR